MWCKTTYRYFQYFFLFTGNASEQQEVQATSWHLSKLLLVSSYVARADILFGWWRMGCSSYPESSKGGALGIVVLGFTPPSSSAIVTSPTGTEPTLITSLTEASVQEPNEHVICGVRKSVPNWEETFLTPDWQNWGYWNSKLTFRLNHTLNGKSKNNDLWTLKLKHQLRISSSQFKDYVNKVLLYCFCLPTHGSTLP